MTTESYALQGNDTVLFEIIQLIATLEGIFYIQTITNQNDGLPVHFTLKSMSDTS